MIKLTQAKILYAYISEIFNFEIFKFWRLGLLCMYIYA